MHRWDAVGILLIARGNGVSGVGAMES